MKLEKALCYFSVTTEGGVDGKVSSGVAKRIQVGGAPRGASAHFLESFKMCI